jgi:hypothetical protein
VKYETDFTVEPRHFDIVASTKNKELDRFKSLIEKLSDNKIRFEMPQEKKRPSQFSEKAWVLIRK